MLMLNWKGCVTLTLEMPDQQPDHKSNDESKDHHTDHGSDFPGSLCLLEFFVVRSGQKLDRRLPFFVLEDSRQRKWVNKKQKGQLRWHLAIDGSSNRLYGRKASWINLESKRAQLTFLSPKTGNKQKNSLLLHLKGVKSTGRKFEKHFMNSI